MYPVSDTFRSALVQSHRVVSKVQVINGAGTLLAELPVNDGNIKIEDVAIRRSVDVTLVDPDGRYTPGTSSDLLYPSGNELRLFRGIRFPDGTEELIPLGVFGITKVRTDDSGEGFRIRVEGYDRARRVQRARLTSNLSIAIGTNYGTAIIGILNTAYPNIQTEFQATTRTTPNLNFEAGKDPWKIAQDMATNIGYELFFDVNGICRGQPIPDYSSSSIAWAWDEDEYDTALYYNRQLDNEQNYNYVVVTGESPDNAAPVRAEARDEDPLSPTYIYGPYGIVTYFYSSQFIRTEAQAQDTADGLLNRVRGTMEQLDFSAIANPALDVGDVIRVIRSRSKIGAEFIVDKLSMSLSPSNAMNVSVRTRRVA